VTLASIYVLPLAEPFPGRVLYLQSNVQVLVYEGFAGFAGW
jgi:hypothetical protein